MQGSLALYLNFIYKNFTIQLIRILTRIVDGLETVFGKLGG